MKTTKTDKEKLSEFTRDILGFAARNLKRAEAAIVGTKIGSTEWIEATARFHEANRFFMVIDYKVKEIQS